MKKRKILYLFLVLAFILPSGYTFAKEVNRSMASDEINRAPVLEYIYYEEYFPIFSKLIKEKKLYRRVYRYNHWYEGYIYNDGQVDSGRYRFSGALFLTN